MRTALILVLFGVLAATAFGSCPRVPIYNCLKDEKPPKCTATEVCAKPYEEACGDGFCEYPYTCASLKKKECKDWLTIKQKCSSAKKVCKGVRQQCGVGSCSLNQDCVKQTVCNKVPYKTGLVKRSDAYANAEATAVAKGGNAVASAGAISYADTCNDCADGEILECHDEYKCVAKEACKDLIVKKCVRNVLKPGIDVAPGGFSFGWHYAPAGEKCGDDHCGEGYSCANVVVLKCATKCGDKYCNYGHECVTEQPECSNYAYLSTICRDVHKPVCVPLSPYLRSLYKPPCKTIWACEKEPSVCGGRYCPESYTCGVDYKPSCGTIYNPYGGFDVIEDPIFHPPRDEDPDDGGKPSEVAPEKCPNWRKGHC